MVMKYANVEFALTRSGKWPNQTQGLIDLKTGCFIMPMGIYCNIDYVGDGRAVVYRFNDDFSINCGLFNIKTGYEIAPLDYTSIGSFSEGLALASKGQFVEYGYIDIEGTKITEFIYDYFSEPFMNGLARVGCDGKWGLINKKGDWVLEPYYDYIDKYINEYAVVGLRIDENQEHGGSGAEISFGELKCGIIKIKSGELIMPYIYSSAILSLW